MHRITISPEERNTLRGWLFDASGATDLGDAIERGVHLGEVEELRQRILWTFGVLDEIGWEAEGSADFYTLTVTPDLIACVTVEREAAESQATWESLPGVEQIAAEERAKGTASLAIAESILRRCELEMVAT